MSANNGGPAFPQIDTETVGSNGEYCDRVYSYGGMTLRDYFAAKAMQAYLAASEKPRISMDAFAKTAYAMADSMLAERAKGGDK